MADDTSHARKVMEGLVWRLEILQHRSRYSARTGRLVTLPTRIRRFANAHPQDLTAGVLAELVASAPYSGVVYNGDDEGNSLKYRPTSTYIKKDDTLKAGTKDWTYTIVQDLLLIDEIGDAIGPFRDASSCSRVSTSTYYWDESDIPDCPEGGQGVTYRITGVARDKETDLFSFQVEKTVALTQHFPEHTVACDREKTVTEETWDNVYGEPGNYRWNGSEPGKDDGAKIILPDPCSSAKGVTVEVSASENDDCTYKLTVRRTTAREADGEYSRYRDQYFIRMSDTVKNAMTDFSEAERAAGREYRNGLKTTLKSVRNPDGTYNRETSTEQERPVPESIVEVRKTIRGQRRTTTNRHMPTAAPVEGLSVGDVVRNEKTEGGLYNQVLETLDPVAIGFIASGCQLDVLHHQHSATQNVDEEPEEKHAFRSGSGKWYQLTVKRTEADTFDVDETSDEEFNHEYGSRVHEDAMQAQAVIEETSGHENRGDVNGVGQEFSATHEGSEKGQATALADGVATPFDQYATTNWFRGTNMYAQAKLTEKFTSGKVVTGGGFKRGVQYVSDSELTKGGRWHTKTAKYVPKPQAWLDATEHDGNSGRYEWKFRNLTQEQCKELVKDMMDATASPQYATWACHPFVNRSMNDFGLYDGSIGFEARNISGSGGGGSIKEWSKTFGPWTEKSVSIRPISELDPSRPSYSVGSYPVFQVTTVEATYKLIVGVGATEFAKYAAGKYWASPTLSYNQSSQAFSVRGMISQKTVVSIVVGTQALPEAPQAVEGLYTYGGAL